MKSMIITPKSDKDFKFLSDLIEKLGYSVSSLSEEEIEDLGLSKLMQEADKSKKVSRSSIMKKLKV